VDLPAFGNPTRPISAIIFNVKKYCFSSPLVPFVAFFGV